MPKSKIATSRALFKIETFLAQKPMHFPYTVSMVWTVWFKEPAPVAIFVLFEKRCGLVTSSKFC